MEKAISITLTLNDWNYVLSQIAQRPISEAMNLFFAMRSQVEQQAAAPEPAPAPANDPASAPAADPAE